METKPIRMEQYSQHTGWTAARHLSQIREESDSRELSPCLLRSLVPPSGAACKLDEVFIDKSDPAALVLYGQQRKLEENRSLLEELTDIEAELRQSLRLDVERKQEAEFLRQQENKLQWQNLCYLSLSQRVAKPWVSSYFRKFPMHIYCLPVQPVTYKGKKRLKKKG